MVKLYAHVAESLRDSHPRLGETRLRDAIIVSFTRGGIALNRSLWLLTVVFVVASSTAALGAPPTPLVTGLKNPESLVAADGRVFVTAIGDFGKDGDGSVVAIDGEKATPFATGLDDPKGIAAFKQALFVTDKNRVLRIDQSGKVSVFAAAEAFPSPPQFLNDITVDERGTIYVSDTGAGEKSNPAIYRIDPRGKVTLVADAAKAPVLKAPNGLLLDSHVHLLVLDFATGELHRMNVNSGATEKVAEGFDGGDGLAWDHFGRLYVSSWKQGDVWVIGRPGEKPVLVEDGFQSAADICLDSTGKRVLVPDMKAGTVSALPTGVPGLPVDERPLPIETAIAFPDLQWAGWSAEGDDGRVVPLRPIVLTHAGDDSDRVFVGTQQGVIHVFPNDDKATKTKIFLDISQRVRYTDRENEEGFLGMAFHPKFKENGEFFVFYTVKRLTNVISRFRVSKDDPDRADPASEEEIFRIDRPYWNHDGGTVCFGPDNYMYVVLGDGGLANDPHDNAQNLGVLLGKVLRIDVDRKDTGLKYGIPKDNPFVGVTGARPEIWCYGLRNPWRIAFDAETKALWAGDVGQNLWEEIDILTPGGNFGWNRREGLHAFGPHGTGPRKDYIEPIWEYHHDLGKSITGGPVYRGKRLPELAGHYLYADYVTNKLWALRYDDSQKRVVANRPIRDPNVPVMSFGEDQQGEAYFMTYTPTGRGIYRFVKRAGEAE
jgi:glucose/arabinose dehydrogenase